jgi:hypothetical protein
MNREFMLEHHYLLLLTPNNATGYNFRRLWNKLVVGLKKTGVSLPISPKTGKCNLNSINNLAQIK